MRETQIVDRIRKLAEAGYRHKTLLRGIGDDCAILRPRSGHDLVFTSDFFLHVLEYNYEGPKVNTAFGHK